MTTRREFLKCVGATVAGLALPVGLGLSQDEPVRKIIRVHAAEFTGLATPARQYTFDLKRGCRLELGDFIGIHDCSRGARNPVMCFVTSIEELPSSEINARIHAKT